MPLDEGFVSAIPEEIRNEKSFQEIAKTDPATFAKTYVESQKTLGRAFILPDEKDDEAKRTEKINAAYEKLGRPKTHSEYDKDIFPEGRVSDEQAERYLKAFHEAGLNNSQAKRLVKEYFDEMTGSPLTVEGGLKALSEGWGADTEKNVGVAKAGYQKYADEELKAFLEESGLASHPAIVKHFYNLGKDLREDSTPGTTQRHSGEPDKAAAQSKLAEIMSKPFKENPYFNSALPGHKELVSEVTRLHKIINGEEVVAELGLH